MAEVLNAPVRLAVPPSTAAPDAVSVPLTKVGVTDVKVLSTPSIVVVDNQVATLQVGDQIPVTTQSATAVTAPGAPVVTNIDYRNTGVILRVVPRITRLGDEAGDALIDGLNSRKTFARQAFALALGHLKLRRAVVPLLHLIGSETTDVWREVARIYGTFGNASFRTLSQKLHDAKAPEERYVLTLAHLANHGCAKQVEALAKDSDKRVATMATRALALRDDARRQHESVTGARPLENDDGVLAFSRRFVQELEGTAPEGDLATLPGEDA